MSKGKQHLNFKDRTGEMHTTNEGYTVEIIEYNGMYNCTVQFPNGYKQSNLRYDNIIRGTVKNPYHKSVHGVGYTGVGKYVSTEKRKSTKCGSTWRGIMERCYSEIFSKKHSNYKGVTVCEEWHNFQNFAKWFEENYNPETMKGWHLDKDILSGESKIYSPETCCFVPNELNVLFTIKNKIKYGALDSGVFPSGEKFRVQMCKEGKKLDLGSYETSEEASKVYNERVKEKIKSVADNHKNNLNSKVYNHIKNL